MSKLCICLAVVAAVIAGIALVVSINGNMEWSGVSYMNIMGLVGVMISSIALLFGCYFAVLAVSGYAHIRNVEEAKAEVEKAAVKIKKTLKVIKTDGAKMLRETSIMIDELLSHEMFVAEFMTNEGSTIVEYRKHIVRRRKRLIKQRGYVALTHRHMPNTLRKMRILELSEYMNDSDVDELIRVYKSSEESEVIRRTVGSVLRKKGIIV